MKLTKKRFKDFDDYDSIRKSKLSAKEIAIQDRRIKQETEFLRSMQDTISKEVAKFMVKQDIGINELTRRLQTSSRQTNRIMSGQANITLATIAELAVTMGKKPGIIFD